MSRYRDRLPQLSRTMFVTDGGLETTMIFHEHIDLPSFAAFTLLQDDIGRNALPSTSEPMQRSRGSTTSAAFSKARRGARALGGAVASAARRMRWTRRTARRSSCSRTCARSLRA